MLYKIICTILQHVPFNHQHYHHGISNQGQFRFGKQLARADLGHRVQPSRHQQGQQSDRQMTARTAATDQPSGRSILRAGLGFANARQEMRFDDPRQGWGGRYSSRPIRAGRTSVSW
jgi:hypothetical protein